MLPTDSQLLTDWNNGDPGAFSALVRRFQDPLLRHARGLVGWGGPYEDVVQEVFLKLAREPLDPSIFRGDEHERGKQLAAWLHTATRNACMNIIRSENSRKSRERAVAPREAITGGQARVDAADTRDRVEEAIGRLPVDQREVLILRLLAGRSYREIAEVTGRKVGTVGWLISQGLKSLEGMLSPLMEAESKSASKPNTVGTGEMGIA